MKIAFISLIIFVGLEVECSVLVKRATGAAFIRKNGVEFVLPQATITKIITKGGSGLTSSGLLDILARLKDIADLIKGLSDGKDTSVDKALDKTIGSLNDLINKMLDAFKDLADTLQGYKDHNQIPEATQVLNHMKDALSAVPQTPQTKPLLDLVQKALAALKKDKGKKTMSPDSQSTVQAVIDYLRSIAKQDPQSIADTLQTLIEKLQAAKASGDNSKAQKANDDVKAASDMIAKSPVAGNMNEINGDTAAMDESLSAEKKKGNARITPTISKEIDDLIEDLSKLRDALQVPPLADKGAKSDISDEERKKKYKALQGAFQNVVNKMQAGADGGVYSSQQTANAYKTFQDTLDDSKQVLDDLRVLEPTLGHVVNVAQQAINGARDTTEQDVTEDVVTAIKGVGDMIKAAMTRNGFPISEIEVDSGIANQETLRAAAQQAQLDIDAGKLKNLFEDLNKIDEITQALEEGHQPHPDLGTSLTNALAKARQLINAGKTDLSKDVSDAAQRVIESIIASGPASALT